MLHSDRAGRFMLAASVFALTVAGIPTSGAQVGHLPSKSPYEDVKMGQELTVFSGYFSSNTGAAGVLPKPSLFGGLRYDLPVGGPAVLTARYTLIPSERTLVDPAKPRRTRVLGVDAARTHMVDVGMTVLLTGQKSWHRLVPALSVGTGLASDFAKADTGGYNFGTKFGFTGGASVRYMLRNSWVVRVDATNYLWRNSYPDSYYAVASDTTAVLRPDVDKKSWKGTWGWSMGLGIPIFR
ncbi:MAG: hypothetical protein H7Z40_02305 [Phycisphaerae bacterium]|nr:hypothetical protein [Gemmatimonadaceae bacterium]